MNLPAYGRIDMTHTLRDAAAAFVLLTAASLPAKADPLAIQALTPKSDTPLQVNSTAITPGVPIASIYSAYGQGQSPPLQWTNAPDATKSFLLMVEDPDAGKPPPFVHWIVYGIPADSRFLGDQIPPKPVLEAPADARQGANSAGGMGYTGMKPPAGDPPHHYYFQVFALDAPLDLPPGADRARVLNAAKGHVLASGEIVAPFQKPKN